MLYMNKELPLMSYAKDKDFFKIYKITRNINKAIGVIYMNSMYEIVTYNNVSLLELLEYHKLDDLKAYIKLHCRIVLEVPINNLIPCRYISRKRTYEKIIEQLKIDNDLCTLNYETYVNKMGLRVINMKYNKILDWYLYYLNKRNMKKLYRV